MADTVAAVDLGASSGRVILGHIAADAVRLETVARFPNSGVDTVDGLHWNVLGLYGGMLEGLRAAARSRPRSVGIDSWAVDYGLLRAGRLLGAPHHHRDERTTPAVEVTHRAVPFSRLYRESGLQFLPFNTVYQLVAELRDGLLDVADTLLLIPDLLNYWLTGRVAAERTNASTTGLLDVSSGEWNRELMGELSIPESIFPDITEPGTGLGPPRDQLRLPSGMEVMTVASHDTASAVAAIPTVSDEVAYISSGTWSLVGVEVEHPVISAAGREANFTNEAGVDGRIRLLRNVSGLWLLEETLRLWREEDGEAELAGLLEAAAEVSAGEVAVFDARDARFIAPGDMPARIAAWCVAHDIAPPATRAALVRSILESLAEAYAVTVREATRISGKQVSAVHIIGGGTRNTLLCQLTADRTGLPVYAGPAEATALGNVLIQARTLGRITGSLEALRAVAADSFPPTPYRPRTAGRAV